ncbi:Cathepsin B [Hypsibius exemplaris]|uniref:Cathepsin B n=1 Tax=Hypsibius exemplaris TaxID=2072580 RepID=A0A1W0WZS9_HYPEX|nr:Cathepsin B [Hypsibius exemplaris]
MFLRASMFFFSSCLLISSCSAASTLTVVHQEHITSGGWLAGLTSLSGLSHEDLRRQAGTVLDLEGVENEPHKVPSLFHNKLVVPAYFDARRRWPHCPSIGRIYEQGSCGACWALAGAAVISDRICIASKNQTLEIQISPQDALICSGGVSNLCTGGYPKTPYVMYTGNGLVTGGPYLSRKGCMPYEAFTRVAADSTNSSNCIKSCSNSASGKVYKLDKHYGSGWYAMGNRFSTNPGGAAEKLIRESVVKQIQYELSTNGPLTVGIYFYKDFVNYKAGVYRHVTGERVGGHAMKLIGWGSENKSDYWLLANSWGTKWGSQGFVKFLRGENHLGIENYLVTALPQLDKSPTAAAATQQTSISCDASSAEFCAGKVGYAVHPPDVCTAEWCYCGGGSSTAPKVVSCPDGQSFDADPSVYGCADTDNVNACKTTNSAG